MVLKLPILTMAILATVGCASILGIDEGAVRDTANTGGAPDTGGAMSIRSDSTGTTGGATVASPAVGGTQPESAGGSNVHQSGTSAGANANGGSVSLALGGVSSTERGVSGRQSSGGNTMSTGTSTSLSSAGSGIAASGGTWASTNARNGGVVSTQANSGGTSVIGHTFTGGNNSVAANSGSGGTGMDPVTAAGGASSGGSDTPAPVAGGFPSTGGLVGAGGQPCTLEIPMPTLPIARTGEVYSAVVTAAGAVNYDWSLLSGSLPPGLSLNVTSPGSVEISGTPTGAGLYPFRLGVTGCGETKAVDLLLQTTHRVAFLADRDTAGVQELYVTNVGAEAAGSPVKLNVRLNSGLIKSFKWSPEGGRIAYLRDTNELMVVQTALPGVATSAGQNVTEYTWLATGETLAIATSAVFVDKTDHSSGMVSDASLYFVETTGASPWIPQSVSLPPPPSGYYTTVSDLVAAPIGRALGLKYSFLDPLSTGMWSAARAYVHWSQASSPSFAALTSLSKLPAAAWTFGNSGRLATMIGPNGGLMCDLSVPAAPACEDFGNGAYENSIDPMSDTVFCAYSGVAILATLGAGGWAKSTLVDREWTYGAREVVAGPWSPDGRNVLLEMPDDLRTIADAKTASLNSDVSILPDGLFLNAFTDISSDGDLYGWSPNSAWVAFAADKNIDGVYDLFLVRWPGPGPNGPVTAMATGAGVSAYQFAPNSSAIALVGTGISAEQSVLWLSRLPASGGATNALALTNAGDPAVRTDISWLPGSRMILYRASDTGGDQLHGVHITSDGSPSAPMSLSGIGVTGTGGTSATGVVGYQPAPLPH